MRGKIAGSLKTMSKCAKCNNEERNLKTREETTSRDKTVDRYPGWRCRLSKPRKPRLPIRGRACDRLAIADAGVVFGYLLFSKAFRVGDNTGLCMVATALGASLVLWHRNTGGTPTREAEELKENWQETWPWGSHRVSGQLRLGERGLQVNHVYAPGYYVLPSVSSLTGGRIQSARYLPVLAV